MWPQPPLERSIFGIDPIDEFTVTVADWIWEHAKDERNVEIEAKVGTLVDTTTGQRLRLPVLVETIVDAQGIRFESDMALHQHAHYNTLLNTLCDETSKPSHRGARVTYERQLETDAFYASRPEFSTRGKEKVRVTRNQQTLQITNSIIKRRVANLEVYSPRRQFDFRISINVEEPVPPPDNEEPSHLRHKNRVSYTHQAFQVDLTQVDTPETPGKFLHELEVEMVDAPGFLELGRQARQASAGDQWTPFEDRVLIFLNNVRMLIRNAAD